MAGERCAAPRFARLWDKMELLTKEPPEEKIMVK